MIARVRSSGPAILRGRERISAGECISKSPRVGEDIKVLCAAAPIKQQHGRPYRITFTTFTTFTGLFLAPPSFQPHYTEYIGLTLGCPQSQPQVARSRHSRTCDRCIAGGAAIGPAEALGIC